MNEGGRQEIQTEPPAFWGRNRTVPDSRKSVCISDREAGAERDVEAHRQRLHSFVFALNLLL